MKLEELGEALRAEFGEALAPGVTSRALMLGSEVGELLKEVLKSSRYGQGEFAAGASFCEELGDVMVDLALLAHEAGVSLPACTEQSVNKLRARLAEKGHVGSEIVSGKTVGGEGA